MRLVLFLTCSLLSVAADCDVTFTFTSATAPANAVQWNNKGKACANWQFSYFSSGFSAVNIIVESAPDAGSIPGAWVTFAGSVLSGSNPFTATNQGTSTLSGVYPWMRVRLASKTGTGVITGRLLGVQSTTAAVGFLNSFEFTWFGTFVPPIPANFTQVDFNTGTQINTGRSIILWSQYGVANNIRNKLCASLTVPYTFTVAWRMLPRVDNGFYLAGFSVRQSSNSHEETNYLLSTGGGNTGAYSLTRCTTGDFSSCTVMDGGIVTQVTDTPFKWQRVVDNGTTRLYSYSDDGANWTVPSNYPSSIANATSAGADYAATTPNQGCFYVATSNGNFKAGAELVSWSIQ